MNFTKREEFYTDQDHVHLTQRSYSVWQRSDAPDVKVLRGRINSATQGNGLFLIVQSNSIPLAEYYEAIREHLL